MTTHIVVENHGNRARRFAAYFTFSLVSFFLGIDVLVLWMTGGSFASHNNAVFMIWLVGLVGAVGIFQLYRLAGDGPKVAGLLGGTLVVLEPAHAQLKQFRNVATEAAIAAALPMPQLFVLEHEQRINAFAAGPAGGKTVICVSEGALRKLTREELQGVVAHEMAHLKFDDVALSKVLASGLFGLLCFTLLGKLLLLAAAVGGATRTKEGAGAGLLLAVLGLAMLVTGWIGYIAAGILDAAVSREMEFRADAEAVRMLSTSEGLIGALVKLGQQSGEFADDSLSDRLRASNPMFFGAATKRYWFDTHPPLLTRIRALNPARAAELETIMGK